MVDCMTWALMVQDALHPLLSVAALQTEIPDVPTGECPINPPRPAIDPPADGYEAIFPFNMLIFVVDTVSLLGADPVTPELPPLFPDTPAANLHTFDNLAVAVRLGFKAVGFIGACFMLYKLASQSKEGE